MSARIVITAAGAALGVLALTGCGSNPLESALDNAVEGAVEQGIEQAAGEDVDIDVATDGGTASLPDDFPTGLPLPEGCDLISSLKVSDAFSLSYTCGSFDAYEAVVASIKADGAYTSEGSGDFGGLRTETFRGDGYVLSLTAGEDGSGAVALNYAVAPPN